MSTASTPSPVSSGLLLRVWLALSIQSFGGGGATLTLIRRAVIDRYGWVTEEEFARDWAICQVAPGINLTALAILIGRRIAGWRGIALCLIGLFFPSVVITILMTAFYAHVRDAPIVQHALRAIIPASVGLGLFTAYEMALPPLKESRRQGNGFYLLGLLLILGSGAVMLFYHPPVVLILLATASITALSSHLGALRKREAVEVIPK